MAMQIILIQDVPNLGTAGELVSVKPGFGRNYLVPRGMAVTATVHNKQQLAHEQAQIAKRVAKARAAATEIAAKLSNMTLQFERAVGEGDKMFGSVTSRDLSEQLKKAGVDVDHRAIVLEQPIKAVGKYETTVKLEAGVVATLKFWVVGKEK
jgi:large subunit ribosomal protein L9